MVVTGFSGDEMKTTNWRFVIVGGVMIGLAIGFFIVMGAMAPQSTDPAALMSTVGTVSGVVAALGITLGVLGFMGKIF
jgi:hypothetical protein